MDKNGWIDKSVQSPTLKDADEQHCVLCWHIYQGLMVTHINNVIDFSTITHWRPALSPPEVYQEGGPDGAD